MMWPLLLTSIITVSVVIERIVFIILESRKRDESSVQKILTLIEAGDADSATAVGQRTQDFVARVLTAGLIHRGESFTNALLRASNHELKRFNRGLSVLDTVITLAPLLGLLGTVTGMIHSFGLLGGQELGAPTAITGGIAQALIATAFGLGIAITALIPFNYLNARLEEARHEIEDVATHVELLFAQHKK